MPYHSAASGTELHIFAQVTSSDPGAIGAGKGWVDTSSGPPYQLKIRNTANDGWENVGVVGDYALDSDLTAHLADTDNPHEVTAAQVGAMVNPMTTQADIIVGGVSGAPARLAKGSNNTVLGVDGSGVFGYKADPSGGSGGHTIEDEGAPLTARSKLNFVGAGVAVTDDSGDDATVVTISGGGGGSLTVEEDGGTSVASVTTITVPTGSLTDDGSGAVTLNISPLMLEQLRLDAGAGITKDGSDLVSLWSDQSLYERYAIQSTSTAQPLWVDNVINSEPVVRFDGVDNVLVAPLNANMLSTFTIAAVFRPRDSTATEGMMSWGNAPTSNVPFIIWQRDSTNVKVFVNSGYRFTVAHATDATKLYVLTFNGIQWDLYVDGVAQTPYVGADASRANGTFLYIGVGFNGYSYVDIPAVEVYGRVLSSGDRGTLTTRLMTKYGL